MKSWVVGVAVAVGLAAWWFMRAGLREAPAQAPEFQQAAQTLEQRAVVTSVVDGAEPGRPPAAAATPRPSDTATRQDALAQAYRVSADEVALVRRALAGGTPAEALKAAELLKRCANADNAVKELFEARDQQSWLLSKVGVSVDKTIVYAQAFQRDCQVFDTAAHARTGALFEQAHAGAAPQVAVPYLRWLQREGAAAAPAALVSDLQRQVRAEAEAADYGTLMVVALTGDPEGLGIGVVERAGFERAWHRIQEAGLGADEAGKIWGPLLKLMKFLGDAPPALTPAQDAQAEALAQRVVAAHQHRQEAVR